MAKPELGTKRTCPETGKNFYDLNKDPIISPYTGKEYPITYFEAPVEDKKSREAAAKVKKADSQVDATEDDDETEISGPEIISLEDVDEGVDADDADDEVADVIADVADVELDDDDDQANDDTFLEDDDDDTDFSAVIGKPDNDEKDET